MNIDRPEDYFKASIERISQAKVLYDNGSSFALSMYVSGLAVECMLRAHALLREPDISERPDSLKMFKAHDLSLWFKKSGLMEWDEVDLSRKGIDPVRANAQSRDLQAAASKICIVWMNLFRFASEERVRSYIKKKKLDRGKRGDFLKENARILLNVSEVVVTKGTFRWNSLRK